MTRLAIVVEGQTEEAFVKELLSPHLTRFKVLPTPLLIGTLPRREFKGGNVSVQRIADTTKKLLHSFDAVTTLVDFCGFRDRPTADIDELQAMIDQACRNDASISLRGDRVFAYVQHHEFEALLFSQPGAFGRVLELSAKEVHELQSVRDRFPSPEDINDSHETAPSKRIQAAHPAYNKMIDGVLVAREVGLDLMRAECPRFGVWLSRLEALNPDTGS